MNMQVFLKANSAAYFQRPPDICLQAVSTLEVCLNRELARARRVREKERTSLVHDVPNHWLMLQVLKLNPRRGSDFHQLN